MVGFIVVERHAHIHATPERVISFIADFGKWAEWSPWEDLDPEMNRQYDGKPGTIGSTYAWGGNKKAGAGRMTIKAVTSRSVSIDLDFTRPFKSSNRIEFLLEPTADATRLTWRMEAPKTFLSSLFNLDRRVGPDFEKGLTRLAHVTAASGARS
ncbi:SRPBCC family protein [Leifsonia sp. NPDC102414]|uniref:SRPBCC family protein n=1 Tax=Leifsonia sp. NPDC102414 TaxID=3364124 RepID=UPI0038032EE4